MIVNGSPGRVPGFGMSSEAAAAADASGGRFALGIGASSDRIIEGWNGMPFEKPLSKMSETIDFLRTALSGERADGGFKLERAPEERVPIIVAALRGKMLRLAVEKGDGAFTNFLPLASLPKVAGELAGAPEGFELPEGRRGRALGADRGDVHLR